LDTISEVILSILHVGYLSLSSNSDKGADWEQAYDALYHWCRDATDETHDWVSHQPKGARCQGVPK
jgi:hypothetical protein